MQQKFPYLLFCIITCIKARGTVYLWCCNAECRVSQFEPFLRFLSGQTSSFPQLLKLIGKLEEEKRDVCPPSYDLELGLHSGF